MMKKNVYPHLNDSDWLEIREKEWEKLFFSGFYEQPKYSWEYKKKYFFDGDVNSFIKREISYFKKTGLRPKLLAPTINHIVDYSPCNTLEQFITVIETVFDWYDQNNSSLCEKMINRQKSFFEDRICDFSRDVAIGFDQELTDEIFTWIYGDSYDRNRKFPITLGADGWQPELTNYDTVSANLLHGLSNYLFMNSHDSNMEFSVLKYKKEKYSQYLLSLLPYVDVEYFSLDLKKPKYVSKEGNNIYPKQLAYWRFFMGLLGFNVPAFTDSNSYYCRDLEMVNKLKKDLFSLEMPAEFQDFIGFLESNGEEAYKQIGS